MKGIDSNFEWYFIIMEDNSGPGVSANYCRLIRNTYGLNMTVLHDPDGRFAQALNLPGHHYHIILDPDGEVVYRRSGNDSAAVSRVRQELRR